jgi:hypothetical protein
MANNNARLAVRENHQRDFYRKVYGILGIVYCGLRPELHLAFDLIR